VMASDRAAVCASRQSHWVRPFPGHRTRQRKGPRLVDGGHARSVCSERQRLLPGSPAVSPAAVVGLVDDLLVGIAIQEEEASLRIGPISSKRLGT
jgi:hypothetical protein